MKTSLITASTGEPFELDEIKDHLRIPIGDAAEDAVLNGLIRAARENVESMTNRKLKLQTRKLYLDEWPGGDSIQIPHPPLNTVTSTGIVYKNSEKSSTTFSSTGWLVDTVSEPGRVCLEYKEDWPTAALHNVNPISVEYKCGYSASSDIPEPIKLAMKLLIGHWYENREDTIVGTGIREIPNGVKMLLQPLRDWRF